MNKVARGFTLIELMIGVAIIGILAGIAYPSYLKQVQKSNRSDAKVELNETAQRLQRCFTAHGKYDTADGVCAVVDILQTPDGILSTEGFYQIKIADAADLDSATYKLTATPVAGGRQDSDDECDRFTLNQLGVREAFTSGNVDNTDNCW